MMINLNHNLLAASAASNLQNNYSRLAASVQRLSSGLRINSAADDAAGLAIRELMRADVASLNQGMRNANDAISMLQVADGALYIIDEKLIRMKELAEQAATGTYDSTQRLMISSEFQAMAMEIDRIANATDFNGIKLLDGSLSGTHNGAGLNSTGAMKVHFGTANDSAEDYYYVDIGDCSTKGLDLREVTPFPKAPVSASWINEAHIDYAGRHIILDIPDTLAGRNSAAFMKGLDFYQLPVGLKNITVTSNAVLAHPFHKPHVCLFDKNANQISGPPVMTGMTWNPTVSPGGGTTTISGASWWNGVRFNDFYDKGVEEGVFNPGLTNFGQYSSMNALLTPGGRFNIPAIGLSIQTPTGINEIGSTFAGNNGTAQEEILELNQITNDLVFFIGGHDNPSGGCNRYSLRIEADITDEFLRKLKGWEDPDLQYGDVISIETQDKAQKALVTIDNAIVKKDKVRAHLGGLQNRFENTVTNLSIQSENMLAAESRISDADVATEMMAFVRNQILTQSATAMLSQANSFPHMMMGLIGQ